jgi:hypothetical protein
MPRRYPDASGALSCVRDTPTACDSAPRRATRDAGVVMRYLRPCCPYLSTMVGSVVGHARVPTWHTLWAQINRRVSRLSRIYEGTVAVDNTGDLEDEVDALLLCNANLRDWLIEDPTVPDTVTSKVREVTSHDPLKLCIDYANTFKHHTRPDGRRHARLYETAADASGVNASLRYWTDGEGGSTEGTVDTLEFARECVAEWRAFFRLHDIRDPQPP